jgi:ketosteroid isomerase-like protein
MPTEQSAELVRRYFRDCVNAINGPDRDQALAIVDELLTDDFTMSYNNETDAEAAGGRERHKAFLIEHAEAFPDDNWAIEALVADEEVVACQWRIQANHAKTGNRIDVHAADIFRVRDGRLAELRRFLDFKSFERQLRRQEARHA